MGGALRRTPLYGEHAGLGAKLVGFNGWEMPLQYPQGILREHEAVRSAAGVFDVSHMGRFEMIGPGAVGFTDYLITNNLRKIDVGQLLYSPVCREDGGVLDDVTVYRLSDRVMVVVNAGNRRRIWDWLGQQRARWEGPEVAIRDQSEVLAQIALQGPKAEEVLAPLAEGDLSSVGYYRFWRGRISGIEGVLVSRNGYTGEDGFEIYLPAENAVSLWRSILDSGREIGISPTGLGARDTLRLEMSYCLYGNELSPEINPLEAGLGWTVKLKKETFVGRDVLESIRTAGLKQTLVGFEVEGGRLARSQQRVFREGVEVGRVTSGGYAPSLKRGIGLAYVSPEVSAVGTRLEVDVRGERSPVRVVERPFYRHGSHK